MRALRAIVCTRLRKDARTIAWLCAACGVVGFLQPHDAAERSVWIAGPVFFGTLCGIVIAIVQRGTGRLREIELVEQSAPLYGRELARATALVPCIGVSLALGVYWSTQFVTGNPAPATFFALAVAAVNAATLVALSATLRRGAARYLYVGLAGAVAAISYLLAVDGGRWGLLWGVLFCLVIGFVALRQYGEALARYDPIPAGARESATPGI